MTPFGPNAVRVPPSGRNAIVPGVILDERGNPYRKPANPLGGGAPSRASISQVYRDLPTSPIEIEWEVDAVRAALTEHCLGQFFRSSRLIDSMMGNDRIQSALGARTGALLGLPETYEGPDDEVTAAWRAAWPKCHAPPGQGETLKESMRLRLMAGLSVSEVVWDTDTEDGLWQPYLKPWDLANVYLDVWRRQLVAMTEDGPEDIVPGNGKWFVTSDSGVYRSHIAGLVRALALPWLLHQFARRDWARYSERHGMPMLLAEVPAMAGAEDKKRFETDLVTMGREAIAVLPQNIDGTGFDIRLLEATAQSWQGFDSMILRCENAITIAIQWQNLTTEVKEGSEAAARVHGDVKQTAVVLDATIESNDVYEQLARPFALYNFGDADKACRVRRDVAVLDDKTAELAQLNSFALAVQALVTSNVTFEIDTLAAAYRIKGLRRARIVAAAIKDGVAPDAAVKEAA